MVRAAGGGGGLRSAIYRDFPQFYHNFSVVLLFKNFIFPLRKILSLPVTGHTVRVRVLICPACHLCGRTLFCFCVPKMSSLLGTVIPARVKGQ